MDTLKVIAVSAVKLAGLLGGWPEDGYSGREDDQRRRASLVALLADLLEALK